MANWRTIIKDCIEKELVGLNWAQIENLYDDKADRLTHQVYRDGMYWDCIFDNNICIRVEFAFQEI